MRVEVYREPVPVNMASLMAVSDGKALQEFYRIAMNIRDAEINTYERLAVAQDLTFSRGVETLSYDSKFAILSFYLDIEDDTKAIYFKMSIEPVIKSKD